MDTEPVAERKWRIEPTANNGIPLGVKIIFDPVRIGKMSFNLRAMVNEAGWIQLYSPEVALAASTGLIDVFGYRSGSYFRSHPMLTVDGRYTRYIHDILDVPRKTKLSEVDVEELAETLAQLIANPPIKFTKGFTTGWRRCAACNKTLRGVFWYHTHAGCKTCDVAWHRSDFRGECQQCHQTDSICPSCNRCVYCSGDYAAGD